MIDNDLSISVYLFGLFAYHVRFIVPIFFLLDTLDFFLVIFTYFFDSFTQNHIFCCLFD